MKNRNKLQRDFDYVARLMPVVGTEVARFTNNSWSPPNAGPLASKHGYLHEIVRNIPDYDVVVMYRDDYRKVGEYYLVGERQEEGKTVRDALAGFSDLSASALTREAKTLSMWRYMGRTNGNISFIVALAVVGALAFIAAIRALLSGGPVPVSVGEAVGTTIVCTAIILWVRVEAKQNHRKFLASLQ